MAESRALPKRSITRQHAFVAAALLCYGLTAFLAGTRLHPPPPTPVDVRQAELRGDSALAALTAPTRPQALDPDPLEAFMEVYEHLRSKYVDPIGEDMKQKLAYGAIKGMLRELADPYTRFMEPTDYSEFSEEAKGDFEGIGAMLGIDHETNKIQVVRVFRDNPAARGGLKPGDYILAIDDKPTDDMNLDVAVGRIRGKANTQVKLTVERPDLKANRPDPKLLEKLGVDPDKPRTDPAPVMGEPLTINITRGNVDIPIVEHQMMPGKIGYVWLSLFNEKSYTQLRAALTDLQDRGAKGVILDLRANPGGMLDEAVKITGLFLTEGAVVHIQERNKPAETMPINPADHSGFKLPVVVLVDEFSASASEIVSGALQDYGRAKLVGETTYGKGLVQSVVQLSDGSAVAITTAHYLTPNKRDINKKGIKPDVEVEWNPSREVYIEVIGDPSRLADDKQLQRAVEVLKGQLPQ